MVGHNLIGIFEKNDLIIKGDLVLQNADAQFRHDNRLKGLLSLQKASFHQDGKTLYPGTGSLQQIGRNSGEGYTVNLPLPPGTGSNGYKEAFESIIPVLGKQFNPEVIIYQCGVDTHHSDLLANLNLTYQTYYFLGKNS